MARPKKAAPQWPVGGEPKAAPVVRSGLDFDPKINSLADAIRAVGALFEEPPTRDAKAADAVEAMSGGKRVDGDFPALFLNEKLAAEAWWRDFLCTPPLLPMTDDRLIWVEYPELIKLQITIMDMRDRTHRVGNDRYVVRSRHAVVKAEVKAEAA
jgi:hypothetical protein